MVGRSVPRSKRDGRIPYTYEAQVDRLRDQGTEPLNWSYFADTICGLVELMIEEEIRPQEVTLYGAYGGKLVELEVERCVGADGDWLTPPQLCRELEAYYLQTMDERYLGHVAEGECMFDDRDRTGHGPY